MAVNADHGGSAEAFKAGPQQADFHLVSTELSATRTREFAVWHAALHELNYSQ